MMDFIPLREADVLPSTEDEIMRLGYPSQENIVERYGYILSYNSERKVANWVMEYLTHKQIDGYYLTRKDATEYIEDKDINGVASLADCTNWLEKRKKKWPEKRKNGKRKKKLPKEIGYERGHLAAAANHGYNRNAYNNTYLTSNIVPMFKKVNNYLRKIEEQARKFVEVYGSVNIITGTIFGLGREGPTFAREGSPVQVPHAIFKVLVIKESNKYKVYSYMVENLSDVDDTDMNKSLITLREMRRLTGLNLLGKVPEENIVDMSRGCRNHGS